MDEMSDTETFDHPRTRMDHLAWSVENDLEELIERGAYATVQGIIERISARLPEKRVAAE